MKKWIAGIAVLWLAGCSTKPIGLNYYMLHQPTLVAAQSSTDISNQPTIFFTLAQCTGISETTQPQFAAQ